jgi:hypothetical protein
MKVGFARLFLLAGLMATAAPALAVSLTRYAGETSQGTSISLRLSPGRRVALRIYYRVSCNDGRPQRMTYTNISGARIVRGRFGAAGVYKGSVDGSRNEYRIGGNVTSTGARGTFSLTATTRHHVRCSSGRLSWVAQRA